MSYAPHPEEMQLVQRCLQGDAKAQQKLFELFYGKMLAVCLRYTQNREEAKDMLQDGFMKVFQKLDQFTFTAPLDAWVRRIMVNTAIDHYRKNAAEPVAKDIETAYDLYEENDVIADMGHADLLDCLHDLPAGYRMVFNMYVIEGYSHKEIAEAMNVSEGTSKSQLSKARAYLQKIIANRFSSEKNG
ncbi:MAG: RNA polymerase sigma factor [Bacteroidia bacterium]